MGGAGKYLIGAEGFPADITKYADRNTLRIYAFSVIFEHPDFSRHSQYHSFSKTKTPPIQCIFDNIPNSLLMNLELNDSIDFQSLLKVLTEKLPGYTTVLKKNPIARFEYIQVRKSAYVGLWIRIFPDKKRVMLIKTIPSTMARAFLGGLIAAIIASGAQGRLRDEVADVIKKEFNTTGQ